jgi:hypothetical protein
VRSSVLTVRSRNVGSQFGAWLTSLRGGELKGMTKMPAEGRQHATERLAEEAESNGANVIVAFGSIRGQHMDRDLRVRHRRAGAPRYIGLRPSRERDADMARRQPVTARRSVVAFCVRHRTYRMTEAGVRRATAFTHSLRLTA